MKGKLIIYVAAIAGLATLCSMRGFREGGPDDIGNPVVMLPKLSDYHIFQGRPSDLVPADSFQLYELATGLFTDYAEKQRLIKVPAGHKITAVGDGLPEFPDGTILVKTFYYFNVKKDTSKGKRLIETRLLVKSSGGWSVGTYVWNPEQTEAILKTGGMNTPVSWVDANGRQRTINFHIPSNRECATCHNSDKVITPIGPKMRNLNIDVMRDGGSVNQLFHLQHAGVMSTSDISRIGNLPLWQNTSVAIQDRVRAYLDVNCAHCHSEKGSCSQSKLRLGYETAFNSTHILEKKDRITKFLSNGRMPRIGTTIIDEEAVAMITNYLKGL